MVSLVLSVHRALEYSSFLEGERVFGRWVGEAGLCAGAQGETDCRAWGVIGLGKV